MTNRQVHFFRKPCYIGFALNEFSKRVNIGLKRKVPISPWNSKTKKASGTTVASKQLKTLNVISKRHSTPDGHYGSSQDQRPKKINGHEFHQFPLAPFIFDFKQ